MASIINVKAITLTTDNSRSSSNVCSAFVRFILKNCSHHHHHHHRLPHIPFKALDNKLLGLPPLPAALAPLPTTVAAASAAAVVAAAAAAASASSPPPPWKGETSDLSSTPATAAAAPRTPLPPPCTAPPPRPASACEIKRSPPTRMRFDAAAGAGASVASAAASEGVAAAAVAAAAFDAANFALTAPFRSPASMPPLSQLPDTATLLLLLLPPADACALSSDKLISKGGTLRLPAIIPPTPAAAGAARPRLEREAPDCSGSAGGGGDRLEAAAAAAAAEEEEEGGAPAALRRVFKLRAPESMRFRPLKGESYRGCA